MAFALVLAGVLLVWMSMIYVTSPGTPGGVAGAFGSAEPPTAGSRCMLRRSWGLRLDRVPEASAQRDVPFWTAPGSTRPLLCDVWRPPAGVPPSGLAFIYFHGSAWVFLDKDVGTRPFLRHLAAQGARDPLDARRPW